MMFTIHHHHISLLLRPLLFLSSLSGAAARLVNRTIDDENGDSVTGVKPVYAPSDNPSSLWTQGATCTTCNLVAGKYIDVSQVVDGTWHDATYKGPANPPYTIDASFTGTAVYVYFIVPNFVPRTTTYVNLSFLIDNVFYNQYEHVPDPNSTTFMYNTLVFHTTDLVNTNHNIEVRASGSKQSVLLFDNMIYTVDEADQVSAALGSGSSTALPTSTNSPTQSPPSSPPGAVPESQSSPSVSAIAGGVAGGIAVLSLVLVLYCCLRKRRHRDLMPSRWAREPQVPPHPAMANAFDPPVATAFARPPLMHASMSSSSEENTGGAGWSNIASYSDIPILPRPLSPDRLISESRGLDPTESKPAEALSQDSLPSSDTHTESSPRREPTIPIRALVTLLQEELESLRVERQLDALYIEPPPHYEE